MSHENRMRGKHAEERVVGLAQKNRIDARLATPDEDGAGKVDVVLENGIPVQVSCTGKSKGRREALSKRGVGLIVAGDEVNDVEVVAQILKIITGRA